MRRLSLALGAAVAVAGLAVAPAMAQTGPWGQPSDAGYKAGDATYQNYRFRDGEVLPSLHVHYLTLGTPHRDAGGQIDNAVLVLHWTGADSAAVTTRAYTQSLYADGRPLDAKRYFLIFPDAIGCGHTSKPSDGLRGKFPNYGYGDMVDIQHKLVAETLGIRHLHAVFGMSMGGMNAWQWAEAYPDAMDGIMPVVSLPIKVSGRNAIWRHLVINLIRNDPAWKDGDYTSPPPGFAAGYSILRMMIDGVSHLQQVAPDGERTDAWLNDMNQQSRAADPNDVLYSIKSSADYDPEPGLSRIRTKVFALNFDDDEFNPDQLGILERLTPTVPGARYVVQKGTAQSFGHLTMAHPELWSEHVGTFMRELDGGEGSAASPRK
ncbi:alpha/beta fold hydrolase [Gluconacetobacter sacchari]|uniref:Alpha/beta fold hydrolase n=2 Tax=Gluconacetobacter sacchari TaxID=92759 RepID=A0A7W4NSH4_9PROT|nr:alpha/beta fold hydrolase [Gluconacetobacter sacchari]